MLFIKTESLKVGMRLARPIYNKNGVLLYERNSKITTQGITSVKNFGIIGIYILEPAEPVPPMTKDDIAFERFQTMEVFAIQEELKNIVAMKKTYKLQSIVADIIRNYGRLDRKINFIQNLRSAEDMVYKHSLNVSILCAMMSHKLSMRLDEQMETVSAAILHDIGKSTLSMDKNVDSKEYSKQERYAQRTGYGLIEQATISNPNIRRTCMQAHKALDAFEEEEPINLKMTIGSKTLMVAELFDSMTAMYFNREPESEVSTIRLLLSAPTYFDCDVVNALIHSINILSPGVCVELNTGEKGLVLVANDTNILRPMILGFDANMLFDLSRKKIFDDIEIKDIMKTMDNRYIMDIDALKKYGVTENIPVFEEAIAEG